jgi:hypothetical protein
MTPKEAIAGAYDILPERMRSAQATVMLLAIQLQEAPNQEQRQIGGPAVGIWQFENGGGIKGVLAHPASAPHARAVCAALGVPATRGGVYAALQTTNDVLDAAFARLLLFTDPKPLPGMGNVEESWQLYLRTWRPGAHSRGDSEQRNKLRQKWSINYAKAMESVVLK